MQLFIAIPMTPLAAVYGFGGRRYHRFIPFNFLLSLAAPHLHGILVLVTGNKFCSPVSLKKFETAPMEYSGAQVTMIHEKVKV
jgi:hypothetical protein